MQKTKLGISVGLMGLIMCLAGMFTGYVAAVVIAGYILLAEENIWLKKTAAKVICLMLAFSVLSAAVTFIPTVWSAIESFVQIFSPYFFSSVFHQIFSFFSEVVSILRTVVFAILAYKSISQGTIKIPVVDGLLDKHFGA